MRVPLMDLKRQYAAIRAEIDPAIREVVESQSFILGPAVDRFELALGAYHGVPRGVGVASGSEALVVALLALGVGPGDEVVTTPHTFYATASAIARVGARPVFADIEPATMTVDPDAVEEAITRRTKAILPVHLYGHPARMLPILETARRRGLHVVEDCAQAIGATWQGKKVGLLGAVGCFSAYPAKNLGAFGDAGFLVSSDAALSERLALWRNNGCRERYYHDVPGYNARLDSIQAAVLEVKLRRIDAWNAERARRAGRYVEALRGVGDLRLPPVEAGCTHVFHLFMVRTARRDALAALLRERGIDTQVYYPLPLHLQEAFRSLGHRRGDFPEAEKAAAENLALPLFPELVDAEQDHVIASVLDFYSKG